MADSRPSLKQRYIYLSLSVLFASNGWSQSAGARASFIAAPAQPPIIAGAPFSAVQEVESTQTLGDGTHIVNKSQSARYYRDSAGRTRIERFASNPLAPAGTQREVIGITINDKLAGVSYGLTPQTHIARRFVQNPSPPRTLPLPGGNGPSPAQPAPKTNEKGTHPEIVSEDLGSQMIGGVLADGTRTTITTPTGLIGNDRPIVHVTEQWFSQELRMVVLSKTSDPRLGESITRLTNIDRSDPDPSLFQVPPDYTIQEQNQGVAGQ